MKLGTIKYNGKPTAIIKGLDGKPRLLSKVCEASNLKPIHNLLDFIEGNNQIFLQCIEKTDTDNIPFISDTSLDWLTPITRPSKILGVAFNNNCLLYTSPSPRD